MGGNSQARHQEEIPLDAVLGPIARYFKFAERSTNILTETRAGLTTFMVMCYIIFLNGAIIAGPLGLDPVAVAAGTCLIAGAMTILMGVVGRYPFAIAAGLGINALVAFTLPGKGFTPAECMGVIVIEGVLITILVVAGLREAIMNAVPLVLKRSIGVGIGLFILYIGFVNAGLIVPSNPAMSLAFPTTTAQFVFLFGLAITIALYALKVKASLILSIVITTIIALLVGVSKVPADWNQAPNFSTFNHADWYGVLFGKVSLIVALLTIFAVMLSDFFDTMGTVTGIAAEAGLAEEDGSVPGIGRVLFVDSIAAFFGGWAGISSNTTYIESAAGVAEGGRTGFASVITGLLFLAAILVTPLASVVPFAATGPALVVVGYLMFTQIKGIEVLDIEDGLPALLTIILMPLTYDITVGIGAGFVSWVFIKMLKLKFREVHWLMYCVAAAFVLYFANAWILTINK
jgi:AGZA family xanthine/uracil permease-like MFS transporter